MSSDKIENICLQRLLADLITKKAPLNEIRLCIAQGARVNIPVTQGLTPLHYSVFANYAECVELLLIRGAEINQIDEIGYTAVHLAAEKGFIEIMKILIKAGARVNFTDNQNLICQLDEPLRLSIKNGHYEITELLLKHGANPNAIYFLGSELNLAANINGNLKFIELLLRYGAKTESRNRSGLTPLLQVAQQKNGYETVKVLLKYNADVHCYAPENEDFRSVLHYAVKSGNLSLLRLLLFCGANPVYPCEILKKPSSLGFAIIKGDVSMVKLLIEFGSQLNTGCSLLGLPLHIALSKKIKNRKEILVNLLENGADPNLITMDNRGPCLKPPIGEYFNNSEEPEIEIVRLLLKYHSRVICTAQVQHPLGILKSLNKLKLNNLDEIDKQFEQLDQVELNKKLAIEGDKKAQLFNLIINACELFNFNSIKRCTLLNQNQKRVLLHYAKNPLKLKHLTRLAIRKHTFRFATYFFNDDDNASCAYYALENRYQQNSPDLRSKSFDYNTNDLIADNWQNHDLMQDSYLYNKNAYKKYVGNRYQKCINRIEDKLFISNDNYKSDFEKQFNKSNDEDRLVFNKEFAIRSGLTTEEMDIVLKRREYQLNEQSINRLNLRTINDDTSINTNKANMRNVALLPIGFRLPPGHQWPIKLIELDSKFNDYNFKYYSSLNSASTSIDQLREFFNFDSNRFKCSSSYAIYILENLPLPTYLRKYLLYEED